MKTFKIQVEVRDPETFRGVSHHLFQTWAMPKILKCLNRKSRRSWKGSGSVRAQLGLPECPGVFSRLSTTMNLMRQQGMLAHAKEYAMWEITDCGREFLSNWGTG